MLPGNDRAALEAALDAALAAGRQAANAGAVASYIPALALVPASLAGLAVTLPSGETLSRGDSLVQFTIQSVSKILSLMHVMAELGEDAVFSRVGKEPTGDPFNSIIRLETSTRRKPFNPLINAGAIVVSSLLPGRDPRDRVSRLAGFVSRIAGRPETLVSEAVFESERGSADRNRAIAWFLKELGLLEGDVEEALEAYFLQCSLELDAESLSRIGAALAMDGMAPWSGERIVPARVARTVKGLMMTCGMYDGTGEFVADAGLPAKSGVGGGIRRRGSRR